MPAVKETQRVLDIVLKAVPLAMGTAVTVIALLDRLDAKAGFSMLGIGLACVGVFMLKEKK